MPSDVGTLEYVRVQVHVLGDLPKTAGDIGTLGNDWCSLKDIEALDFISYSTHGSSGVKNATASVPKVDLIASFCEIQDRDEVTT